MNASVWRGLEGARHVAECMLESAWSFARYDRDSPTAMHSAKVIQIGIAQRRCALRDEVVSITSVFKAIAQKFCVTVHSALVLKIEISKRHGEQQFAFKIEAHITGTGEIILPRVG